MFNPFSGLINIVSFGVDVYKKIKQRKAYEKDMATIAELERYLDDDKLHDKKNNSNGQSDNGSLDNGR